MSRHILALRQDNNGDVLLAGPALRALAGSGAEVTLVCGPRGAAAGRVLPGVARVLVFEAAWIDANPLPLDRAGVVAFMKAVARLQIDEAAIFTSFHQSALPAALLLRLAGVPRIGAISEDYAGSLLDVRHRVADDIHEVRRALSLVRAMGYELPADDDARLRTVPLPARPLGGERGYVVVHPGATVPARTWSPDGFEALTSALAARGRRVVVTGSNAERSLTQYVAGDAAIDAGGKTNFAEFLAVLRDASVVVCGNTAAAHGAAAVETPVVSLFPPTIPVVRFAPWMVPHVILGDQQIGCAGCRARVCPHEGHPCLANVTPQAIVRAVERFAGDRLPAHA